MPVHLTGHKEKREIFVLEMMVIYLKNRFEWFVVERRQFRIIGQSSINGTIWKSCPRNMTGRDWTGLSRRNLHVEADRPASGLCSSAVNKY